MQHKTNNDVFLLECLFRFTRFAYWLFSDYLLIAHYFPKLCFAMLSEAAEPAPVDEFTKETKVTSFIVAVVSSVLVAGGVITRLAIRARSSCCY